MSSRRTEFHCRLLISFSPSGEVWIPPIPFHFSSFRFRVVVEQTAFCLFLEFLRPPFNLTLSYMEINGISPFFVPSPRLLFVVLRFRFIARSRAFSVLISTNRQNRQPPLVDRTITLRSRKYFPTTFLSRLMTRDLLARDPVIRAGQMFPSLLEHEPIFSVSFKRVKIGCKFLLLARHFQPHRRSCRGCY